MSKTSSFYRYGAATQGFLLWGGWAFYINSKISLSAGLTSGLAQGISSFVSTLIVVSLLTRLFNYFHNVYIKLVVPTLVMMAFLSVASLFVHNLVNTPKIIQTITPSLIVAVLFCSFTTYKLKVGVIEKKI